MKQEQAGATVPFEKMIADPEAVYDAPEEVVADERLSLQQRLEILQRWAHDADRLAVAESEGMGGGEPAMQNRALEALHHVEELMTGRRLPTPRPGNALGAE
ncbi:MAG TPA: hypothetical protein VM509_08500 [Planctomycetota bacterium]|nr:hypothetical protein [Planctomycetota bacterium]